MTETRETALNHVPAPGTVHARIAYLHRDSDAPMFPRLELPDRQPPVTFRGLFKSRGYQAQCVRVPMELLYRCMDRAGRVYVFEGRFDRLRHRTRQAVWKDLHRAARLFRLDVHVSPHSTRKAWAVDEYKRTGNLKRVQREMNHTDPAVTMLYALADQLEDRKRHPDDGT